MVGRAESIAPMWTQIRSKIDVDPETDLVDHVYLGCTQRDKKPSKTVVRDKQELFSKLLSNQIKDSDPEAGGETALLSKFYTLMHPEKVCKASKGKSKDKPKQECSSFHHSVPNPSLTDSEYDQIKGWELDMSGHAESVLKDTVTWQELQRRTSRRWPLLAWMTTPSPQRN